MKKFILLPACAAMLLVSCVKESIDPQTPAKELHYTLAIGLDDGVKATIGEPDEGVRKMSWNTGDRISVNGNVSDALKAEYDGKNRAVFTFSEHPFGDAPYLVCYGCSYTNSTSIVLPFIQTGADGADKAKDFPMASYIKTEEGLESDNLVLYQLCGFINTRITGADASKLRFVELSAGENDQLSGTFKIQFDNDGVPSLTPGGIKSSLDRKVRVGCEASLSSESESHCLIALPAGTYNSSKLRFVTGTGVTDGQYFESASSSSKAITRGRVKNFNAAFDTGTSTGDYAEISSASDWNTFATAFNAGEVTNDETLVVGISDSLDFSSGLTCVTADFSGKIEGNGFCFKNISASQPLLNTNGATIENLTLDGTFNFSAQDVTANSFFGPFAGYATATDMTNCVSRASVTLTGTPSGKYDIYVGGLVGQNHDGVMTSCTNKGSVTVDKNFSTTKDLYAGGLTGKVSGTNEKMIGNVNTGAVNIDTPTAVNAYIGGIIAAITNGQMQGVINQGTVTVNGSKITNTNIGGVAGYVGGSYDPSAEDPDIVNRNQASVTVTGAENLYCGGLYGYIKSSGTLTIPKSSPMSGTGVTVSVSGLSSGKYTVYVGGLIGYTLNDFVLYPSGTVSMNKAISVDVSDEAKTFSALSLGGIVGHANAAITLGSDVGNIMVGGNVLLTIPVDKAFSPTLCGIGGVLGSANANATIKNCSVLEEKSVGTTASGSMASTAKSNGKPVITGGIAGYIKGSATTSSIENCINSGNVQSYHYNNTYSESTGASIGGIIGNFGLNITDYKINITGSSASGALYGYRGYVGGIAGYLVNATVSYDTFTGTISRGGPLGGISAVSKNSSFTSCSVKSTKLAENSNAANLDAGGVAGVSTNCSFDDCKCDVLITKTTHEKYTVYHGGITGSCDENTTIGASKSCYLRGTIAGTTVASSNVLNLAVGNGTPVSKNVIYLGEVKKKLSIIGDSISTFEGYLPSGNLPYYGPNYNKFLTDWTKTYWGRLINVYMPNSLVFEKNISWSGSCVAQDTRTEENYRPAFITRYGRSNYPDGQTYDSNDIGEADAVIIFGGTNDKNQAANGLTDVTTTPTDEQFATIFAKTVDALSETSYVEAYVKLIRKIQNDRGVGVKILLLIGDKFDAAQVASVKKIQENFTSSVTGSDIQYVDLSDKSSEIPKASGSHPTEKGMDFIARTIYEEQGSWLLNN